jgi:hypothetical protein
MVGVQHDKTLKINTHKGLPCGNKGFIRKLSDKVGRDLSFKKRGRPKKGLEQLRSDIELTNKYIKEGLLKFDENMNVIYDKRNTNDKGLP